MTPGSGPSSAKQPEPDTLELLLETAFRRDSRWVGRSAMSRDSGGDGIDEPLPEQLARYRVVECIGRGGVGIVYRVRDESLDRAIAIKVLRAHFATEPEHVERFEDEARLLGRLVHPGIVPVHESGKLPDGRPYFTMRLVEGETLAAMLQRRTSTEADRAQALHVLRKTCEALSYAHALGVTHGDVKPQNVMVGAFGEVQIMDFGFARSSEVGERRNGNAAHGRATRAGTPAYMAPEQARGDGAISPRTDVFGLGGILCEILTGAPPNLGDSRTGVIASAASGDLTTTRARLEACTAEPALVELALGCLESDPMRRPGDARHVAELLARHQDGVSERARAAEVAAAEARASLRHGRRVHRLAIALVTAVAAGVVTVVLVLGRFERQKSERRRATAATVEECLVEARRFATLAGERRADAEILLRDALAACRRAQALASTHDGDAVIRASVATLTQEIELSNASFARARQLAGRLAELRHHVGDERSPQSLDAGYLAALAGAGIAGPAPAAPAAKALLELELGSELIEALDDWVALRKRSAHPTPEAWREVLELVTTLDTDAWRNSLRVAWAASDVPRLEALAKEPFDERQSALSLSLLGRALTEAGKHGAALEFYRRACVVHPNAARLCHDHAMLVRSDGPLADAKEEIRLLWMAAAVEPDDGHLLTDLAIALVSAGDAPQAAVIVDRALRAHPGDARSWYACGVIRRIQRAPGRDVRIAFQRADELGFAAAKVVLADLHLSEGRVDAALPLFETLVAKAPGSPMLTCGLAFAAHEAGQVARASALVKRHANLRPANARIALGLASIAIDSGRFGQAADLLENAARSLPDSAYEGTATRETLVQVQRQAADFATLANRLVDLDDEVALPEARGTLRATGYVARRMERPRLAARAYRKLLADREGSESWNPQDLLEGAHAVLAAAADGDDLVAARSEATEWLAAIVAHFEQESTLEGTDPAPLRRTTSHMLLAPDLAWLHDAGSESRPASVPASAAALRVRLEALHRALSAR